MRPFLACRGRWPVVRPRALFVAVVLVPALVQIGCFVYALVRRAAFPMDLEWLEGTQLCEAFRFAHGQPVYGPPEQGFVPSPYPPLYHLVVSGLGRCFGLDYWTGRVVSDASIAAVVALLAAVVVRAARSRRQGALLAVLGAACVAASYRPLEASMDLARVDMLGVALSFAAAWVSTRHPVRGLRAVVLGVLACAAVYTKQTSVFYVVFVLGALGRRDLRGAAMASTVASGLAVVALLVLQRASGGWFWTWMTTMRHHPLQPERCLAWGAIVAAGGGAGGGVFVALHRRGWLGEPTRFWAGMLAASVPACVAPMLSGGGWVNNLIGLVMLVILVMLLIACDILRNAAAPAAAERAVVAGLAALLLGALYDPTTNVPDSARAADADALHATILGLDGDVLAPMYPFVVVRAGNPTPQMSLVAYDDTAHPGDVNADAAAAIRSRTPRWIILFGHAQEDPIPAWLGARYVRRDVDLRVQALKETTGRTVTLYERVGPTGA